MSEKKYTKEEIEEVDSIIGSFRLEGLETTPEERARALRIIAGKTTYEEELKDLNRKYGFEK